MMQVEEALVFWNPWWGNEDWRKGLILTYDEFEEFEIEGGKVEVMPVWYWLTAGFSNTKKVQLEISPFG